jgi:16S rRNA (cytosine967-C5)-methyltransferase
LLDVPCSNTGVLARRPEVRLRITQKGIISLAKTQLKLLNTAAELLKPGGKICYSTCSIQKQENCMNVEKFLSLNPDFYLESQKLTLPSTENDATYDHDGGYVAIMTKKAD